MKAGAESATGGILTHGATCSRRPVGCAVALRVLEIFEKRQLLTHIRAVSQVFSRRIHGFADHPLVSQTRASAFWGRSS